MSGIEEKSYRQFTKPAELHKAVNTLKGLIEGIQIDNKINSEEVEELMNWCYMHQHLEDRHPFRELLPLIREVYSDGIVTEEEAKDILWVVIILNQIRNIITRLQVQFRIYLELYMV